ncbi:Os12g0206900 [Oryza sativa Japonica Group]|uniref:Os12g0206900 protein n=3 Tax=Oryza TaxID=4527 RepID=Q2QW54_ORYSJ|nr:hypothetical protein LOC_Os12g10530 [Oryza sativa Japonica Group]EAZ19965.1 hypothetical protein OsJ_35556 [Oryza sativa Japonica Group]BAT16297.1 Os12g0206900 [Oryza sativa Japonica Group]
MKESGLAMGTREVSRWLVEARDDAAAMEDEWGIGDDRSATEARDQATAKTMEGGGGGKWEEELTLRGSRGAGRTKDMEKGGSKQGYGEGSSSGLVGHVVEE